jgi:hypothetical protein
MVMSAVRRAADERYDDIKTVDYIFTVYLVTVPNTTYPLPLLVRIPTGL